MRNSIGSHTHRALLRPTWLETASTIGHLQSKTLQAAVFSPAGLLKLAVNRFAAGSGGEQAEQGVVDRLADRADGAVGQSEVANSIMQAAEAEVIISGTGID